MSLSMIFREKRLVGLGVNSYVWVHLALNQTELNKTFKN
jgi:hypothetical protein